MTSGGNGGGSIGPWGAPTSDDVPEGQDEQNFACARCGAALTFEPGRQALKCAHCGFENPIVERNRVEIEESDFRGTLEAMKEREDLEGRLEVSCESCAATFTYEGHALAGECPYCGSPIVASPSETRRIRPVAVLPFAIDETEARRRLRAWLGKLWFAPSGIARLAREPGGVLGVYLPYWLYDSETETDYRGQRGEAYYVQVPMTVMVKGKPVRRMVRQRRIRWHPARGRVARYFDDLPILGANSLPRRYTERLEPWDFSALRPYEADYISGFRAEAYQVDLVDGFAAARQAMAEVIREDVRRDIGGDAQRITALSTRYGDIRYKLVLLPVWAAAYRFRGKAYRFVVNGESGEVQGERPISVLKVALAVIAGLAVLGGLYVLAWFGQ